MLHQKGGNKKTEKKKQCIKLKTITIRWCVACHHLFLFLWKKYLIEVNGDFLQNINLVLTQLILLT